MQIKCLAHGHHILMLGFEPSTTIQKPTFYPHDQYAHSTTYPFCFYLIFTQLLLHHNSHTTNSIFFYGKPQLISSYLYLQHPSHLSSPSHLLQTTHINHSLSQFFTDVFLSTQTTYFPCSNLHPKAPIRPPVIPQAMLAGSRMLGCTFLFF